MREGTGGEKSRMEGEPKFSLPGSLIKVGASEPHNIAYIRTQYTHNVCSLTSLMTLSELMSKVGISTWIREV